MGDIRYIKGDKVSLLLFGKASTQEDWQVLCLQYNSITLIDLYKNIQSKTL